MQDVTSYRSLWFYLWTLAAAKRHGRPVIMYGCGIGPIYSKRNRARTTKSHEPLRGCHHPAGSRLHEGTGGSGVTKPKIALSADTTVSLPLPLRMWWTAFWTAWAFRSMATYIGFVLRPWPSFEEKAKVIARSSRLCL